MEAEMLKGHLDAIVLAALEAGPAHGYAIIETIKKRSTNTFDLPEGTVYPALHRLEQAGLLSSTWTTPLGGPRRSPLGVWSLFAGRRHAAGRARMASVIDQYVTSLRRELDFYPALAR